VTAKILVIDDSAMSRKTLRRILEAGGHTVVEANDGIAGLETYFIERPDLVLLDLVMAGMYGLDVLARLREMDPDARVVVATADIQSSTYEMAERAGALGFITKPFSTPAVMSAVRSALEGAGDAAN
jgi:two-component system chemotaxis response regulator CheY